MKRVLVVVLATVSVLGATFVADAVKPKRLAEDAVAVQDAWNAWALGSSTNPVLQEADDFCGEVVDGRYFLTATIFPGRIQRECTLPAGVELVAHPAWTLVWQGASDDTDNELFSQVMKALKSINLDSVKVKVDGALVPREPMVCPEPVDVVFEPGSAIAELDPPATGDTTPVVSCGWFYVLGPLSPGSHTILLPDKFKGLARQEILFSITVA
jgi:hypothetical protein